MRAAVIMGIAAALSGCDLPKDPQGTLERVEGGVLRAGLVAGAAESSADRVRLAALAAVLGAELRVQEADVHELMSRLEKGDLDVVASLPKRTPFKNAGYTHSVDKAPMSGNGPPVWAVARGENAWLLALNRIVASEASR